MNILDTNIPKVKIIEPHIFGDELSINYLDPELDFEWLMNDNFQLSTKYMQASPLSLIEPQFLPRNL